MLPYHFETVQAQPALGERGLIDICRPGTAPAGSPWPFVLGIHGGGWARGNRASYHWLAQRLLPHGFALITCSYRTAFEAPFPAAYDDLVGLLRWLATHAAEYGLAGRCALLGGSAGGHLACLLATRGTLEHGQTMLPIAAVVAYCPVVDLVMQYDWNVARRDGMTRHFMGGSPEQIPRAYHDASPLHWVHPAMPPLWLAHGDADAVVPMAGTTRLAEKLTAMKLPHHYHIAAGRSHTMIEQPPNEHMALREAEVIAFLREHLMAQPAVARDRR